MNTFFRIACLLCLVWPFAGRGQTFYNPDIMWMENIANPYPIKIIKVTHDSAFIFVNDKIWLKDLVTGKRLGEVKVPKQKYGNINQSFMTFFTSGNVIEIVSIERNGRDVTLTKQVLTNNLELKETGKRLSLAIEKDDLSEIKILDRGNYYEVLLRNGCTMSYGNYNDHYFSLITVDKNLNKISQFVFSGSEKSYVHSVVPDKRYSTAIAYELLVNCEDAESFKHVFLFPDNNGKILEVTTDKFSNYSNFVKVEESNGFTYGYCFKLAKTAKEQYTISMRKFEIKNSSRSLTIFQKDLFVKDFSFVNVSDICTKSVVKDGRVRLLVYPMDYRVGGFNGSSIGHVTYLDFKHDTLLNQYNLPFHTQIGLNPWGHLDMYFAAAGDRVLLGYNDDPESKNLVTVKDFDKIKPVNTDKINYGPVFYRFIEEGGFNKNALRDRVEDDFYKGIMEPNGGYADDNGNFYFPFWNRSNKKEYIIKLSAE